MLKRTYSNATPVEFVRAWQTSTSVAAVVRRIGGTVRAADVRASHYRRRGVPMRSLPLSARHRVDVPALASLARRLAREVSRGA